MYACMHVCELLYHDFDCIYYYAVTVFIAGLASSLKQGKKLVADSSDPELKIAALTWSDDQYRSHWSKYEWRGGGRVDILMIIILLHC